MRNALLSLALLGLAPALSAQTSYIVDSNLDQLFSVNLSTGAATLIASTNNNGLETPADLVWDPVTAQLWTIDFNGGEVGTIDVNTGTFTPIYATGQSGWQAMAWDPLENKFYLNNQTNPDLYVLDAGTGVTSLIGDTGQSLITAMTIGPDGQLWALDFTSGSLMTIDKGTATANVIGGSTAGFQGMAFAPDGRLFASNTNDDSLHRVDPGTGNTTLVGAHGAGVVFAKGFGIVRAAPNASYIIDSNLDILFQVDLRTGTAWRVAPTNNNGLDTPADLVADAATSTLWTIDLSGGEVGTIDPGSGTFTPVFQTGMSGWQAMVWDPFSQKFYLNNQTNPDLYVLDPATGVTSLIGDTGLSLITAMALDARGRLWGIDFGTGTLVLIDKATAGTRVIGSSISGFQGMAFAPTGELYATNTNDDSLYTISTRTGAATLIGAHGGGVVFAKGISVRRGPPGPATSYLVDSDLDQLFSVDVATGAATLIASTLNNGLDIPADLAWNPLSSTLWTIDLSGGEVGTIDPHTGTFTPVFQTNMGGWQAMVWDPFSQKFYLNNQTNPDLYVLDPATGMTTLIGDTGQGLTTAMALDPSGGLWGVDFFNGNLFTIDKGTAAANVVGTTTTGIQGLAFAPDGTLYGTNTNDDSLYIIDTRTAVATLVGAHGAGVVFAKGFTVFTGGFESSGIGCVDSGGIVPTMLASGTPALGSEFTLTCAIQPGRQFALLIGFSDTAGPLGPLPFPLGFLAPGCTLYTSSDAAVGLFPTGTLYSLSVPFLPALLGNSIYVQGAEPDIGLNPLGFSLSNYMTVTIY